MKMLTSTKKITQHYHHQFNIEKMWTYLVCIFFLLIAGGLFYSSWLFRTTTGRLDEPALPTFESNSSQLRSIEKDIVLVEAAISSRVGEKEEVPVAQ
jgi:hypothetical protein